MHQQKTTVISFAERAQAEAKTYMEKVLTEGAGKLLQVTIENEVVEYLENNRERRAEDGQRVLVAETTRNGK